MATDLSGGHTDSVLAVDVAPSTGRVISGGEHGELCVWSSDGTSHNKVTLSVDEVTSICCSERNSDLVYVAGGSQVLLIDLRQTADVVHTFTCNEDEVNQIALNDKEEYLASSDDSGNIKVISLPEKKVYKTLRKHTNICSSVSFRPRRSLELFSGGFDSKLMQWDVARNRAFCVINMEELGKPPDDATSYLVSPPFVHSLALSSDGMYLACGTENALVQVFDASKKNLAFRCTLRGHTRGVSQVHYPRYNASMLLSGGNDGQILLWDMTACPSSTSLCNGSSHHSSDTDTPVILPKYKTEHGSKVNWLTSGISNGQQKFFIVADNSSSLTLYPFPEF